MTPSWDGKDRRNGNDKDHDLLTRIDANLTNFIKEFNEHVKEDKEEFNGHDKRIKNIEKVVWCGAGIIFVLEIFLRILK